MSRIVVDPATRKRLTGATHVVELCDDSGQVLGHFVPLAEPADPYDPQISDEELSRREAEESGRPLADILADLAKRVRCSTSPG